MTSEAITNKNRLNYLDWLRFLVVLCLTPFHAAISFTGMGSVYVYDTPVRDILLAGGIPSSIGPHILSTFTIFLDNWFMHLLFLISGISAAYSLKKRDGGQFMLERCNRLLTPLLIGIIFVVSIQTWLGALSFGKYQGNYFSFFPIFINFFSPNNNYFNWGHLWFLAYLFVFSALALPLFLSIKNKGNSSRILSVAGRFSRLPLLLLPALWIALLEGLFRPGWPGSLNLINDWAVFTISFSFFLIGFLMGYVPELLEAVKRYRLAATILGLTAFIARMSIYQLFPVSNGYNLANIAAQVCRGLAAYGLVLAAMGYGQRYLTWQGKSLGIAKDLSFPLYILHYAPLTAATYLLLNSGLSIWVRWILAVFATWIFVALFTFAARYIPVIRDFFSIRKPIKKDKLIND